MRFSFKIFSSLLLLGLLLQGGCGLFNVYKIEGNWRIEKIVNGETTILMAEFTGAGDYGRVIVDTNTWGEYAVYFDNDLVFNIAYFEPGIPTTDRIDTFTGGFDGHDNMKGTVEVVDQNANIKLTGNWTAVRQAAPF